MFLSICSPLLPFCNRNAKGLPGCLATQAEAPFLSLPCSQRGHVASSGQWNVSGNDVPSF